MPSVYRNQFLAGIVTLAITLMVLLGLAVVLILPDEDEPEATPTPEPQVWAQESPTSTPQPLIIITDTPQPTPTQAPSSTPRPSPTRTITAEPPEAPEPPTSEPRTVSVDIPAIGGCALAATVEANVNVRATPTLDSDIVGYIVPGRAYQVFGVSWESDGIWYRILDGWVGGSVTEAVGAECASLPDDPVIVVGDDGTAASAGEQRELRVVTSDEIEVTEDMLRYEYIIFQDGRIWYNPNFR